MDDLEFSGATTRRERARKKAELKDRGGYVSTALLEHPDSPMMKFHIRLFTARSINSFSVCFSSFESGFPSLVPEIIQLAPQEPNRAWHMVYIQ